MDKGQWTLEHLKTGRSRLTAVSLQHKILIAGGMGDDGVLQSIEVYDTKTGTWQNEMLQLNEPKEEFAGAAAGTRILFGGGNHGGPVKTVDIFQLQ